MGKIELVKEITFTVPMNYDSNDYMLWTKKMLEEGDKIHTLLMKPDLRIREHVLSQGKKYKCKIFELKNEHGLYVSLRDIANHLIIRERAYLIGNQGVAFAYNLFRNELPEGYYNSYGEANSLLGDCDNFEYLLSFLQKREDGITMSVTTISNNNINYLNNSCILCFCDAD